MNAGLEKHLTAMADLAMKVEGLVNALNCCIDDQNLHAVCVSMREALSLITPGLAAGLDTPSRWKACSMSYADEVRAEVSARYGVRVRCKVQIIPPGVVALRAGPSLAKAAKGR